MSEPVQVYTACMIYPEFGITDVIPKVGLSRIFRKNRLFTSFL